MSGWSRRQFMAASAAIPFSVWLERHLAWAEGYDRPRLRSDARSPAGRAALATYARAVQRMRTAIAEGDPRSWLFQWYIHGVANKAAEIARVYPQPSPQRDLAQETWFTCQAHLGQREDFFLPWHRMFVYFFESIIGAVAEDPGFSLPYWNYTALDSTRGVLPDQFRMKDDPTFGSLYVENRNPGVNNGRPIQEGRPGDPLSLTPAYTKCTYSDTGNEQGFCSTLDNTLHGNVHVLVGTSTNMGSVPTAAYDPIFWLHHCNIDRLWVGWDAVRQQIPSDDAFKSQQFVFADANGQRVVATVKDFLAIGPLRYTYDDLFRLPDCRAAAASTAPPETRALGTAVRLSAGATKVSLATPAIAAEGELPGQVLAMSANRRLLLVLRGLKAQAQPGVLYDVYVELPDGADDAAREKHLVGHVNFFDAADHGGEHEGHGGEAGEHEKFYSFDVTALARELAAAERLGATFEVTIEPGGEAAGEAEPVVGQIELVEA